MEQKWPQKCFDQVLKVIWPVVTIYVLDTQVYQTSNDHFRGYNYIWISFFVTHESSGPCSFGQEDFWKLHFENLLFDPVTYLCNQLEQFELLW